MCLARLLLGETRYGRNPQLPMEAFKLQLLVLRIPGFKSDIIFWSGIYVTLNSNLEIG